MRHSLAFAAIAAAAVAATSSSALPLSSPPSGFALDGPVTRDSLLAASEFLASSGLREAGFDRVIIGDGWAEAQRDASGQLVAAGGLDIAAVAAELASKGFSLGITANGGERGCRGGPGSLDHETVDAKTFASWGISYVLYTSCNPAGVDVYQRYESMAKALNATGKEFLFGVKDDGLYSPNTWAPALAHTWSTTPPLHELPLFTDLETPTMWLRAQRNFARLGRMFLRKIGLLKLIADSFEDWRPWAAGDERAVITTWARQGGLQNDSGPTLGWNDMGPMQFGGLSSEEVRSEVLMWAMLKSPLFLGGKPENVPSEAIELLKNADLLKMNRGPGKQIEALMKRGSAEVWINRMEKGMRIVLVNRDSFPATIGFDFRVLPGLNPNVTYSISSLFGPDLKPQHLGHFATRYVSPEEGIKARQVVVLEMIEAEDVDKDRIIIPNLPKDRTENIKEQNEEMKKKRIEEYEKNQAPATSQEHIEKDEL